MKYYTYLSLTRASFYIQKIEVLKEINDRYIFGKAETILSWGDSDHQDEDKFFRKTKLFNSLDEAAAEIYIKIDRALELLENRRKVSLENVQIAQMILAEEKQEALEASKRFRRLTNNLKNLDVQKLLDRKGIVDN